MRGDKILVNSGNIIEKLVQTLPGMLGNAHQRCFGGGQSKCCESSLTSS